MADCLLHYCARFAQLLPDGGVDSNLVEKEKSKATKGTLAWIGLDWIGGLAHRGWMFLGFASKWSTIW
jgi:hypothetical protein